MMKSMTCQTYTITNDDTGDTAKIVISEYYRPMSATVHAWPAHLGQEQAGRYGCIASAGFRMQEGDSINSYTQRIYEQAAILGMDTLRELARPLYREPSTAGES